MFISRRKYEQELEKAYERGRDEMQERFWRDEQTRGLHRRMDEIENMVHKLQAPTEGSSFDQKTAENIPLRY